ncbi:MAG: OmpA/MotB protein [Rhodocyclaceae bacterium]|nr:OmpA/MotB protein [Rhodocyclaceae bacterium]
MKAPVNIGLSTVMAALVASFVGISTAYAADDDAAKLKELERALSAPKDGAQIGSPKAKPRTRAIVFDNEPAPAAAASEPAKAAAAATASTVFDCAAIPPDAKMVSVDFAIQFNVGSATVSPASETTLGQIAKILALSPDHCVVVEGHTDATGNADRNMALSRDRANSVVNYIADKNGVDRKRLVPVGKGQTDTMKNLDPRDPKNRRVVFKVVTG